MSDNICFCRCCRQTAGDRSTKQHMHVCQYFCSGWTRLQRVHLSANWPESSVAAVVVVWDTGATGTTCFSPLQLFRCRGGFLSLSAVLWYRCRCEMMQPRAAEKAGGKAAVTDSQHAKTRVDYEGVRGTQMVWNSFLKNRPVRLFFFYHSAVHTVKRGNVKVFKTSWRLMSLYFF